MNEYRIASPHAVLHSQRLTTESGMWSEIGLFVIFSYCMIVFGLCTSYIFITFLLTLFYSNTRKATTLRFSDWYKAMTHEWLISFPIYFLRLVYNFTHLRFFRHPAPLTQQSNNPTLTSDPIILVHGYLDTPWTWWWFKRQLSLKYPQNPIYTVALASKLASVTQLAAALAEQLIPIYEQTKTTHRKMILIGHSMGGLVSTYYAAHFAPPNSIKALATIGSPFAGTHLAKLGHGENAKEMRRASVFMKQIGDNFLALDFAKLQIASQCDNVISPWQSALIDLGSHTKMTITDVGHMKLLYSKKVIDALTQWLAFFDTNKYRA